MSDFPDWNDIQRYLWGVWRMMTGHADGLDELDFSEDGFWQSFHAITVSLPPLMLNWIMLTNDLLASRPETGGRLSIIGRVAFVDLTTWILPVVVLALAVKPLGIVKRFSPYVVASNWGSVITAWVMVPATLLRMVFPNSPVLIASIAVALAAVVLVLSYRLTHVALKKSYGWSAIFFVVLVTGTLTLMFTLQSVLGISIPELTVSG
ncbi:hypothetical protein [Phyllobacterium sp. SB3]|uniref:hypothetical protein n=1 Tax=Phyllobacterium sp. SB3 TaxID=3156073 RepID=UPI0032AECAE8